MGDETTAIPVIRTGIAYVHQVENVHAITVIVSALTQASQLVSDSTSEFSETSRQQMLGEAEQCVQVAITYLANILHTTLAGRRVMWNSGYSEYMGTITQVFDNGNYLVVADQAGTEPLVFHPSECQIIS